MEEKNKIKFFFSSAYIRFDTLLPLAQVKTIYLCTAADFLAAAAETLLCWKHPNVLSGSESGERASEPSPHFHWGNSYLPTSFLFKCMMQIGSILRETTVQHLFHRFFHNTILRSILNKSVRVLSVIHKFQFQKLFIKSELLWDLGEDIYSLNYTHLWGESFLRLFSIYANSHINYLSLTLKLSQAHPFHLNPFQIAVKTETDMKFTREPDRPEAVWMSCPAPCSRLWRSFFHLHTDLMLWDSFQQWSCTTETFCFLFWPNQEQILHDRQLAWEMDCSDCGFVVILVWVDVFN